MQYLNLFFFVEVKLRSKCKWKKIYVSLQVLELMEPKCESNRVSRARCHARRGAALCKLSAPQHGIPELEAALQLDPSNDSIKRDLYAAKHYFDLKE